MMIRMSSGVITFRPLNLTLHGCAYMCERRMAGSVRGWGRLPAAVKEDDRTGHPHTTRHQWTFININPPCLDQYQIVPSQVAKSAGAALCGKNYFSAAAQIHTTFVQVQYQYGIPESCSRERVLNSASRILALSKPDTFGTSILSPICSLKTPPTSHCTL
jgi:hypothetical protein